MKISTQAPVTDSRLMQGSPLTAALIAQLIALLALPFPLLALTLAYTRSNWATVLVGVCSSSLVVLSMLLPAARLAGGFRHLPGGDMVALVRVAILHLICAFICAQVTAAPIAILLGLRMF